MKDKLIEFETAKLANEKGFDIECLHFYSKPKSKMFGIDEHRRPYPIKNTPKKLYTCREYAALNIESVYTAPTQSILQKWLRKVHNIDVFALAYTRMDDDGLRSKKYIWMIYDKFSSTKYNLLWDTFEEALEDGLLNALKLIKND